VIELTVEYKARRGQEILDDPVFVEMIETARTDILTQWSLTGFDQMNARENLYYQGRALDEMLRGLRRFVADWTVDRSREGTKKGRE
jgi:hypothetical protein